MNSWYEDGNGVVSVNGNCASYPYYASGKYTDNTFHYTLCNGNNCNNVLICYTGSFYQNQGDDRANTYKPSLCNYNENQVCQTQVTWDPTFGYTFQGRCRAQNECTKVDIQLTGDAATKGTYCCTSQYCNSLKSAFQFSLASKSTQIKLTFLCAFVFNLAALIGLNLLI
jgi:hypothetical protein